MDDNKRRQILYKAILKEKEKIEKYFEGIKEGEFVYIDTNSQLKYWLDIVLSVWKIKTVTLLDNQVKWVICEEPNKTYGDKINIFMYTMELLKIINQCIEKRSLLFYYFHFWSNNNTIIAKYMEKKDRLLCPRIDFMITEKCSLKCYDCLNLMQYYKKPQNYDLNCLKAEIDTISETFDQVLELRILGGEPFVNQEIYDICAYASHKPNINKIIIFSNATIVPNEREMKKISTKKCFFYLSEYGVKNQKITQLTSFLKERGYLYYVEDFSQGKWIKHSAFEEIHISKEEAKIGFQKCAGKTCPTISKGRFYLCEFLANATNLKAIVPSNENYIELKEKKEDLKKQLKLYLANENALPGCYFCHRLVQDTSDFVKPAIQCKNPLEYEQY